MRIDRDIAKKLVRALEIIKRYAQASQANAIRTARTDPKAFTPAQRLEFNQESMKMNTTMCFLDGVFRAVAFEKGTEVVHFDCDEVYQTQLHDTRERALSDCLDHATMHAGEETHAVQGLNVQKAGEKFVGHVYLKKLVRMH